MSAIAAMDHAGFYAYDYIGWSNNRDFGLCRPAEIACSIAQEMAIVYIVESRRSQRLHHRVSKAR
jgi:hypothetical protein